MQSTKLTSNENITIMITKEDIESRITQLASEIEKDFTGETLTIVCTLRGAVLFFSDLAKKLTMPLKMDFIEVASYGDSEVSNGIIKIHKDLTNSISGEDVLLVEDIIDTGTTIAQLQSHLNRQNPRSLKVCTLLDKPSRRIVKGIQPDYVGFEIEDYFVLGYGLDYKQHCRNLPFIGKMKL